MLILRWYWWRINAWCEIGAMVASGVIVRWLCCASTLLAALFPASDPNAHDVVVIMLVHTDASCWHGGLA